jgi:hypothetical protein
MARAKPGRGQDPTRRHPAGSRTETRIAEGSELGSDMAGGELGGDNHENVRSQRQTRPQAARRNRGAAST